MPKISKITAHKKIIHNCFTSLHNKNWIMTFFLPGKSKLQLQFISIMLITKPFAKSGGHETSILNMQLKRLSELVKQNIPSPDFWLGYFAAYSSPMSHKTHLPFTTNDWTTLSQVMKNVTAVAYDQVIKQQNVLELAVLAVHSEIQAAVDRKFPGIDINRIGERIQQGLSEVALNHDHLKDTYFNSLRKSQKKQNYKLHVQQHLKKKQQQVMPKNVIKTESMSLGIQCPICLEQVTLDTVCPVSCGHNLHKNCFIEHFKSKVEVKKFPITCPEEGCGQEIIIQDLQQYVPASLLQKYYQFSLHEFVDKNNKNTSWCPTAGCKAVFSHEGDLIQYRCVGCKKNYCLRCKTQSHGGKTCEQNRSMQDLPEDEKQFISFAQGAKMKQCPNCKYWVQKNKGCDHMTCRCTYEFCFRCGAKYGDCGCQEAASYYGDEDEQDDDLDQDQYYRDPNPDDFDDQEDNQDDEESVRPPPPPPPPPFGHRVPNRIRHLFMDYVRRIQRGQQRDMEDQKQDDQYSNHDILGGRGRPR